jgi:hypothetical protein
MDGYYIKLKNHVLIYIYGLAMVKLSPKSKKTMVLQ